MLFRILGPLEVEHGGRLLDLGRPKQRALLAALLVSANRIVSADRLIEELWGDDPPSDPMAALQIQVSRLRKVLTPAGAPRVESRTPGYVIHVGDEELDSLRFEELLREARRAAAAQRAAAAAERLSAALALWRGRPLADFTFDGFAQADIARLEELRLEALEEHGAAALALGRHAELVGELPTLLEQHPLREELWRQLIVALYRCGRQAEALRTFAQLRRRLGEELGIQPGPALRRLEEDVLLQRPELDWRPPAETSPGEEVPHNLPAPRSSLVGREKELAELEGLLAGGGMVTIVGPGGVGKSRLAVEVARRLRPQHPEGVWLAELAPLTDGALVAQAVASALGVREQPGQPISDTLRRAARNRRMLVVLDNCEHLVEAVAELADALLRCSPTLTIIATSREPVRIEGEHVWAAPSLEVPARDDLSPEELAAIASVRLFVERARAHKPFTLSDDNASSVAQVCRRLDGFPLPIELAAARIRSMTPAQIATRLDQRFDLLTSGSRTALPHHQTLRAAVEWSYDLLSESERSLFRRLSVFAGGFDMEAAEAVCADDRSEGAPTSAILADLVDKSLVAVSGEIGGVRYRLHETLRHYGSQRLAEAEEVQTYHDRHLGWAASLAERLWGNWWGRYDEHSAPSRAPDSHRTASGVPRVAPRADDQDFPESQGGDELTALRSFDAEYDNLRAAVAWGIASNSLNHALRIAAALGPFWEARGILSEGRSYLNAVLQSSGPSPSPARASAVNWAGLLAQRQGDYQQATACYQEGLTACRELRDERGEATALRGLGNVELLHGSRVEARRLYEESLALGRQQDDPATVAAALTNLGYLALARAEYDVARTLLEDSLAYWRTLARGWGVGWSLYFLGQLAHTRGCYEAARSYLTECLTVRRQRGDPQGAASALSALGFVAMLEGDFPAARRLQEESLARHQQLEDEAGMAWTLSGLGELARVEGDEEKASRVLERGLALARRLGEQGCVLWTLVRLGRLRIQQGGDGEAHVLYVEALKLAWELGDKLAIAECFEDLGMIYMRRSEFERSATLLAAARHLRETIDAPLPAYRRQANDQMLGRVRENLGAQFDLLWDEDNPTPLDSTVQSALSWLTF